MIEQAGYAQTYIGHIYWAYIIYRGDLILSGRAKPRWGWDYTHDAADMAQRDARLDWEWLVRQFNCQGPEQLQAIKGSILAMLWQFYNTQFNDPGPSNKEVQAALNEILKCAKVLSENLMQLDRRSRRLLSHGFQDLYDSADHGFAEDDFDQTAKLFLRHLSTKADAEFVTAAEILERAILMLKFPAEKKARGPKPKRPIKLVVGIVAGLIEEHCGCDPLKGFYFDPIEERYKGKLIQILEHIFDRFAPDLNMTNAAIGGQIRRTIGDLSG